MPNALLARYFAGRAVFDQFDFAVMSETRHDELFAAWLALPETARNAMDADFRAIFELSCEKGCRAILDEAQWHLAQDADPNAAIASAEKLAALVNHFERAMVTYLDHNPFWRGAGSFSSDAIREASRDGAPPIELVEGDKLVSLFEKVRLGIKERTVFDVDHEFFQQFME